MGEKNDVNEGTLEERKCKYCRKNNLENVALRMNNQNKYFLDLIIFISVPLSECSKKRFITELVPLPRKIFGICGDFFYCPNVGHQC